MATRNCPLAASGTLPRTERAAWRILCSSDLANCRETGTLATTGGGARNPLRGSVGKFHRHHAVVEIAIRDPKEGAGLEYIPSGNFHANSVWLQCAVLAHNLIRWTATLDKIRSNDQLVVACTIRTRLLTIPGRLVNRAGRPTLRLPTGWPWANSSPARSTTPSARCDRRPAERRQRQSALHHTTSATNPPTHDDCFTTPQHTHPRVRLR